MIHQLRLLAGCTRACPISLGNISGTSLYIIINIHISTIVGIFIIIIPKLFEFYRPVWLDLYSIGQWPGLILSKAHENKDCVVQQIAYQISKKMSSSQSSVNPGPQQCIFCSQGDPSLQAQPCSLFSMMNQALSAKHISHSNNHHILPIDILLKLEDPTTAQEMQEYIVYKELIFVDNVDENMKRVYRAEEYHGKCKMLSEYYKFHKDIPHVVERGIEKILAKYYDRRRQYDYKCIKKQLKQEQGLSITSVQDSATENSQTLEQKSRYSTLLDGLEESSGGARGKGQPLMSDSNLLEEICKEIGRALPKTKIFDNDFKGSFYENERNFQNYVKNQRGKRQHKIIKASAIQEHLKRKGLFNNINSNKMEDNYLNFQKKGKVSQHNQTIKNKNDTKIRSKRDNKQREKGEKLEQKKKFIYNTNIKIQIQNALFYPNEHHQYQQFSSGPRPYEPHHPFGSNIASRKSLVGKISTINEDRYRTPVSKIYQPQETDVSTRYNRRRNSGSKKERLKTRESKEFKDIMMEAHQRDRDRDRENSLGRRVMSGVNFKKASIQHNDAGGLRDRYKHGTISVAKLKLQSQRPDIRSRGSSLKRGSGSSQNLRKRSITLSQNKHSYDKIMPIAKYSSSEIKDAKFKGISIKDLLTRKLTMNERDR